MMHGNSNIKFDKSSNIEFHKNSCSGSPVVPCCRSDGRTDRHTDINDVANSHFSHFVNAPEITFSTSPNHLREDTYKYGAWGGVVVKALRY